MPAPESLQKLIDEREAVRGEIANAEKALGELQRKEKKATAAIESGWAAYYQKICELLK